MKKSDSQQRRTVGLTGAGLARRAVARVEAIIAKAEAENDEASADFLRDLADDIGDLAWEYSDPPEHGLDDDPTEPGVQP